MTDELYVLRDVTSRLERSGIPYMLTGSMAMYYYAVPRMTRDIDLVIEITASDAQRLVELFARDYYIHEEDVRESVRRSSMFNIIHNARIVKVDCIVRKDTSFRKLEFARRERMDANGFTVWIVSKEDLILSKLDWARESHSEVQLRDIRQLLKTGFDRDYLENWIHELDLKAAYELALNA